MYKSSIPPPTRNGKRVSAWLAPEIEQTRQLVGLLVDSLEDEGKDSIRPARVKVYSDSLWVLFDHLGTLGDVANSEAAHYYQKGRDAQ